MLLWTTLFCLLSANLALSQFSPPEILASYDPDTVLKPLKDTLKNKDSSDNLRLIRGLLMMRQTGCPTGYGECTNPAGRSVLLFALPLAMLPSHTRFCCVLSFACRLREPRARLMRVCSIWKPFHTGAVRMTVRAARPTVRATHVIYSTLIRL